MPRKRKKAVSLKPIETEIRKARKALRKAIGQVPRSRRKAIALKIRQLDCLREQVEFACNGDAYTIVFGNG